MHAWVFDVDGCLIDSLSGTSLRPGAGALLAHLRDQGCSVLLWSAGGADYARQRATEQGIAGLVTEFHGKAERDAAGRYVTSAFLTELAGAVFVDDRPEDLPVGADIIAVSPYLSDDKHDRGLERAAARAGLSARI
jgi:phosphoglycolate phosphatase-like HAD superfamily hydrolase